MKKLHIQEFKKQLMVLGAASLLVVPGVIYAQSIDDESNAPSVAEEETQVEITNPYPLPQEQNSDVDIELATETTDTPEYTEEITNPETEIVTNGVTLGEAQLIAEAEHLDSVITKTKIKTIDGNAVYAFYFEDGWKVYVQAIDGQVVRVFDNENKKHKCKNKKMKDGEFKNWLQSRKSERRETPQATRSTQTNDRSKREARQEKRSRNHDNKKKGNHHSRSHNNYHRR